MCLRRTKSASEDIQCLCAAKDSVCVRQWEQWPSEEEEEEEEREEEEEAEQEEVQEATGTPSRGSMPPFCGRTTNLVMMEGRWTVVMSGKRKGGREEKRGRGVSAASEAYGYVNMGSVCVCVSYWKCF